jgi:alpha-L-fucosidase
MIRLNLIATGIPDEAQRLLLNIGKWVTVNGEAFYGRRPWEIFGAGPAPVLSGGLAPSLFRKLLSAETSTVDL